MQGAIICQPQPTSWALCMRNQKLVCLLTAIFSSFFSFFFQIICWIHGIQVIPYCRLAIRKWRMKWLGKRRREKLQSLKEYNCNGGEFTHSKSLCRVLLLIVKVRTTHHRLSFADVSFSLIMLLLYQPTYSSTVWGICIDLDLIQLGHIQLYKTMISWVEAYIL